MNQIKSEIESKLFVIETMTKYPSTFGGVSLVSHKVELLRFEIAQLQFKLDTLH